MTVMPVIDGVSLLHRVREFEFAQDFDVPGPYGPLTPERLSCVSWERYWVGAFDPGSYFESVGANYVLACDCGEVGCWPLECRIAANDDTVRWDRFRQPHRPERDYSGFDRKQYTAAVNLLAERLAGERE
jgi:hypothetical protein